MLTKLDKSFIKVSGIVCFPHWFTEECFVRTSYVVSKGMKRMFATENANTLLMQ